MIFYADAFQLGGNPSTRGGFTVVDEHNVLRRTYIMDVPKFTNNHGEILAIAYAAFIAHDGDTIVTDSQCAEAWVWKGSCGPRQDLSYIARVTLRVIRRKHLKLKWQPRETNLAGHYNETHPARLDK